MFLSNSFLQFLTPTLLQASQNPHLSYRIPSVSGHGFSLKLQDFLDGKTAIIQKSKYLHYRFKKKVRNSVPKCSFKSEH